MSDSETDKKKKKQKDEQEEYWGLTREEFYRMRDTSKPFIPEKRPPDKGKSETSG